MTKRDYFRKNKQIKKKKNEGFRLFTNEKKTRRIYYILV